MEERHSCRSAATAIGGHGFRVPVAAEGQDFPSFLLKMPREPVGGEGGIRMAVICNPAVAMRASPAARMRALAEDRRGFAGYGSCGLSWEPTNERNDMPQGDKSAYTDKQKRQAEHIEEGYEKQGVPKKEAESRAWATVNKISGGGKKSGSGRGKKAHH